MLPKFFILHRKKDVGGVSGTGKVLHGVIFANGKTVVNWIKKDKHGQSSVGIFESFNSFKTLHVDSHPENEAKIVWISIKEKYNK